MEQKRVRRPFHEVLVTEIGVAGDGDIPGLAERIKDMEIPRNHLHEVVAAWMKRWWQSSWGASRGSDDFGVLADLLERAQEPEAAEEDTMADVGRMCPDAGDMCPD